jgi:hypothetical protein
MHEHKHDDASSKGKGKAHSDNINRLTTFGIIKRYFKERNRYKNKISFNPDPTFPGPPRSQINHLAIVLDGEVQEIMRAQNRLAALLLSGPEFIEFDPEEVKPDIGWTYLDEKFYSGE